MESVVEGQPPAPAVPLFHWKSYRLYLLICLMITFSITSCNYMHLGVTLVCMVNATSYEKSTVVLSDQCPSVAENSEELGYTGDLQWSPMQQSQLFGAFFYACLITMGFSGAISDRFNAKLLVTAAVLSYTILSFASPFFARLHYYVFLISRFVMGLVEGFVFPCMTTIVSHWIPPEERTTAAAIYTSGHQIASLISVLISAQLCSFHFLGGWPLIFYFFGICGVLTTILFLVIISNRPEDNRFISQKEVNYVHEQLVNEGLKKKHEKKPKVPVKAIFTSTVVHSIMVSEFSYQYSISIFVYFLPSFFRDVMAFDMNMNGFYTSVPFIAQIASKIIISIAADKLKAKYKFSPTTSCKVLQTVSTFGTASVFISMGLFLDCTRPTLAMVLCSLFGLFFAGEIAGAFTATLFIAPSFTGTISSITTTVGSFGSIAATNVVGLINKQGTPQEWMYVFFTGALVNIVTGLVFLAFGSAELQPWAVQQTQTVYQIDDNDLGTQKKINDSKQ